MCGIAGFVGRGDEKILRAMSEALRYRGPDDDGYFFSREDAVGLGFRRLAVIDLKGGKQPMFNEDKTIALVFNGEIYNYQNLRKELEKEHIFTSQSDTEVLVHLYEKYSDDFLKHIEGMFAIALWDSRRKRMLLARDRFGEKPLYWAVVAGSLIFASEPKSLLLYPGVSHALNKQSLFKYMLYEYVPAPATIYTDIFKMAPAQYGVFEKGHMHMREYFSLIPSHTLNMSEREALNALDTTLERAVTSRLVSDVPLGIFLSGGIDSSTIAYYAQKSSKRPIKTFSIAFPDESYDESRFARMAAKTIGSEHYSHTFTKKDFLSSMERISELLDEPMADSSLVPTYLLSKFTRSHVTVALGGDGGDELFMGYQTFRAHQLWEVYRLFPRFARHIAATLIKKLPVSARYFSLDFMLKKFIEGSDNRPLFRNQLWLAAFHPNEFTSLFTKEFLAHFREEILWEDLKLIEAAVAGEAPYTQLSYVYTKQYMAGEILTKVDRASMYNALEIRSPFLDSELAGLAFNLPRRLKLRGATGKYLLKKLMAPRLGKNIAYRKKQGFALPLTEWLRRDLKNFRDEYLLGARVKREGIFNPVYIARILNEHDRGVQDHRKRIWALLIFQIWNERYG